MYRAYGKRWFDLAGSMAALVVLFPIILLLGLAVRMDSHGSAFFRQERIGRDRQRFLITKFRTMADRPQHNREPIQDGGVFGDQDQRITRVGRVLRRFSLDELPQLVNVAKGDMSLVGPRPIIPQQLAALDIGAEERFAVRPGLTGLAQINGRRTLSWPQQLSQDVDYVRRVSFALDLKIVVRTIAIVATGAGIYGSPTDNWRQYVKKERL